MQQHCLDPQGAQPSEDIGLIRGVALRQQGKAFKYRGSDCGMQVEMQTRFTGAGKKFADRLLQHHRPQRFPALRQHSVTPAKQAIQVVIQVAPGSAHRRDVAQQDQQTHPQRDLTDGDCRDQGTEDFDRCGFVAVDTGG